MNPRPHPYQGCALPLSYASGGRETLPSIRQKHRDRSQKSETGRGTPVVLWGRAGRTIAEPGSLSKKNSRKRKIFQNLGKRGIQEPVFSAVSRFRARIRRKAGRKWRTELASCLWSSLQKTPKATYPMRNVKSMQDMSGPTSSSPFCAAKPKSSNQAAPHDRRHASHCNSV